MAKKITETPLIKQYQEMKIKHPDAILLFRFGDFYEIFGEDAVIASDILGITLTRRANGANNYVELAGFPHHALDSYLPKLVRAGKRVAICEQLEDPKLSNKIVKRGITELVSNPVPETAVTPEVAPEPKKRKATNQLQACEVKITYNRRKKYDQFGPMTSSEAAAKVMRQVYDAGTIDYKEYFYVMLINRAGELLGVHKVSEGGLNATSVDVRVIMQAALLSNSSAIILAHNHPSGSLRPSIEDDKLTRKISEAARLIDVKVHDHIIMTSDNYYSFADNGKI